MNERILSALDDLMIELEALLDDGVVKNDTAERVARSVVETFDELMRDARIARKEH